MVDAFDYRDKRCVVMTLCEQKLSDFIRGGPLPTSLSNSKTLIRLAASHIRQLHKLDIIHADIKTDNFLLERRDMPESLKLVDFSSSLQLPRANMPTKLMSRYFRAPEVLHRRQYGIKIDTWSLGCLCYEIVFGKPLFPSRTDEMLALQHLAALGLPPYGHYEFFIQGDTRYYD